MTSKQSCEYCAIEVGRGTVHMCDPRVLREHIDMMSNNIARAYMRLQCCDVPRDPWRWEVCTMLDNTGACSRVETSREPVAPGVMGLLRELFAADDAYGCGFYGTERWLDAYNTLREIAEKSPAEPFRDPSILWHTPDTTKGMSFCLPGCPACEFLDKQRAVKATRCPSCESGVPKVKADLHTDGTASWPCSAVEPSPVKAIADQDPNERCGNCDVKRSLHDAGGVGSCRNWRAEKASGCVPGCTHSWTVIGNLGDPRPEQLCNNGCGLMWTDRFSENGSAPISTTTGESK